jgi:4'-phosphopantetheinyl transferase
VWRVRLDAGDEREHRALLSVDEHARADSLAFAALRHDYVVAHGMLRRILAHYADRPPTSLALSVAELGKPALANAPDIRFNLSHSGHLALVAVARTDVGVDVERWSERVVVTELAARVFSPAECRALEALATPEDVRAGFYAAWTRKEAYMKATGHGITRGFDHFDVTLRPGDEARLCADRLDAGATERWRMWSLDAGSGYSAALVAAAPVDEVLLFDAANAGASHDLP